MCNEIIGNPKLINSTIKFHGENNMLYCEDGVVIKDSYIKFKGDNSLVYLSKNRHTYYFQITIHHKSVCYFGKHNYTNKKMFLILSERKHIFIGDECLFALNCWIRTADPHIIYNVDRKRINPSKSVYIGDHVWCGQNAYILKGSRIGSGCIIGGGAVVPSKKLKSNAIYAGNPVRLVKTDVFHSKSSVHEFHEEDTMASEEFLDDRYIYQYDKCTTEFENIEKDINQRESVEERLQYLKNELKRGKNRFFIGS